MGSEPCLSSAVGPAAGSWREGEGAGARAGLSMPLPEGLLDAGLRWLDST